MVSCVATGSRLLRTWGCCQVAEQKNKTNENGCLVVGLGDGLTNGDDVDDDAIRRTQACACRCCLYV